MGENLADSKKEPSVEQTQIVFIDDKESSFDDISFDEMNLVELPFALLTRQTEGIYEIPLSADGKSKLACLKSSEHGLPNSLAPLVVLGLMWMWKNECNADSESFSVKIRDLVVRYMYPDRFKAYPPNSDLIRSVERQINCIANSRIHTDRWWDNQLKRQQKANVSIISDVKVLDEGGRHRPRVLQVTWGKAFWESMVRRYTKPIDARLVQRLEHPLDLQLYRLLDRQLAGKSRQHYSSIVDFARYKLGMHGKTLESGGRTASSYVAKKLAEAIRRLSHEHFTVRMTIDRATEPFTVTFERIKNPTPRQPHEVSERDLVADLVREFQFIAHGVSREHRQIRISESDRSAAKEWLDTYGFDNAKWMIKQCIKMQKQRGGADILVFRGLQLYEGAAAGAHERQLADESGRVEGQLLEEFDLYWSTYQQKLIELFNATVGVQELAKLEAEERESLMREKPGKPEFIIEAMLKSRLANLKCARMSALDEDTFRAHRSLRDLRGTIIQRHGVDLLASSSDCANGTGVECVDTRDEPA